MVGVLGNVLGSAAGALVSGALGGKTAEAANKANVIANRENIAARERDREAGLGAINWTGPFQTTLQDPATGGYTGTQPGGGSAATARTTLAAGDVDRTRRFNELSNVGLQETVPGLPAAQGIINRDNALQQTLYDRGLDKLLANRQRLGEGIQPANSPFEGATAEAVGDFAIRNRLGGESDAITLLNEARKGDLAYQQGLLGLEERQVPAPPFAAGGPAGTAANLVAQTPSRTVVPDVGAAIPFQAAGGVLEDLMRQEQARVAATAREDENRQFLAALRLRTLGNQNLPVNVIGTRSDTV